MRIFDELKDDFNAFLKNNGIWIAVAIVAVIAITVVLILVLGKRNNKKGQQPDIAEKSDWVIALGGEDNLISSEALGSRLVVILKDKSLMDKEQLKRMGVTNIIEMSEKVTLLLEDKAELVKKKLDK